MKCLALMFTAMAISIAISPVARAADLPSIDLKPCLQKPSPGWKQVGVTLELKWDGTVMSLASCTAVDLSSDAASGGNCGALTGEFPGAPGWEIQDAKGNPLCRRHWEASTQSLTCTFIIAAPPPPPRPGQPRAPAIAGGTMAGPGGSYSKIPILPGAAMLVVYDNPCGGTRPPNTPFANQPLARFILR
jgi:hypothetical protein